MQVVWDVLGHTPWWVYLLFFYLVSRGLKARRAAVVPLSRLAIVPVVMTVWGGWNLVALFPVDATTLGAWCVALAGGLVAGWSLARHREVRADRQRGLVAVPPDHTLLPILLTIFFAKYAFGFLLGTRPGIAEEPAFYFTDIAVSGLVAGVLSGRFLTLVRLYRDAPQEALA